MKQDYNSQVFKTNGIIGKIPPKVVKYGNASILGILLLILGICFMIPSQETEEVKIHMLKTKTEYQTEALVPAKDYGNIHIGQKIQISLDPYPPSQYGFMYGRVCFLDSLMTGNFYKIRLQVPLNQSSFHSKETLKELTGQGSIILEEHSLIHKLLGFN